MEQALSLVFLAASSLILNFSNIDAVEVHKLVRAEKTIEVDTIFTQKIETNEFQFYKPIE